MIGRGDELDAFADLTWKRVRFNLDTIYRTRELLSRTRQQLGQERRSGTLPTLLVRRGHLQLPDDQLLARIGQAYEVPTEFVRTDVWALLIWDAPLDNFVARLRRLHHWDVGTAMVYMAALRSTHLSGDVNCPWLDDDSATSDSGDGPDER